MDSPSTISSLTLKRRLFCLSLPNFFLLVLSACMTIYGYSDEPSHELKFVTDAFGNLGNAPQYLRHFGMIAFFISLTTILALFVHSLLVQFVFCSMIVALIVIQMNAAVVIFGDTRINTINMKLKLQSLITANQTYYSTNHLLVDEIQLAFDCCGTTAGLTWPKEGFPDRYGTCCPFGNLDPATNQCPFELSKLTPCDEAALTWVRFRMWKYFGIFSLCAFFECASLILVLPAIFTIKPSNRKKKSR